MSDLCQSGRVRATKVGHDYYVTDKRVLRHYDELIPPPDVESLVSLAAELGIPRRTASRWAQQGKIEAFQVGRIYRISKRDFLPKVLEYLGLDCAQA